MTQARGNVGHNQDRGNGNGGQSLDSKKENCQAFDDWSVMVLRELVRG